MSDKLEFSYQQTTLDELRSRHERKVLNLNPGFQRQSVWSLRDRKKLIESIVDGYPIPSIFLYRREKDGRPHYDVIDGKQRLESVFMYTQTSGFGRQGFSVKLKLPGVEEAREYNARELQKQLALLAYKVQIVEVTGPLGDVINLFVRINSTGKALTGAEKRHAKYSHSDLLREAERKTKRHARFLADNKVVTPGARTRMRDVELITELLASLLAGGMPLHKKAAVDRVLANDSERAVTLRKSSAELDTTLRTIRKLFPDLKTTRFRKASEFYTLFLVVRELVHARKVFTDRKRNRQMEALLTRFGQRVDEVQDKHKRARNLSDDDQHYLRYLMLTQQSTDALRERKQRHEIIAQLFEGVFDQARDGRRAFSEVQRRLLWHSSASQKCSQCACQLSWDNFEMDHKRAHSRGGRTELGNAALICRSCNASKGSRRRARRR